VNAHTDHTVNDDDEAVMLPLNKGVDPSGQAWADEDPAPAEEGTTDFNAGLASLGFIRAAIRRSRRTWCATAAIGFLVGLGVYASLPPVYQASTTLLLTNGPEPQPGAAVADDQTIAQSLPVAELAVQKLGLHQSASSFLGSYAATPVTDRALEIVVSAPSSNEAVSWASVLATEFLDYRAAQLKAQQNQLLNSLAQQVSLARNHVDAITAQIQRLSAQHASPAELSDLRTQQHTATLALNQLVASTNGTRASTQTLTAAEVTGSTVLNRAAPLPHSRLKHLILYPLVGLILGLVVGLGVVIIRALISDRLRRRDDVSRALGAPVRLSVGHVRLSRWRPGRRGLAAASDKNVQRIVAHLERAIPARPRRTAALAVIPVDDPQVAALSLASLAVSCAQRGRQVVLADLASGAPCGSLLGATKPGVRSVNVPDAQLVIAIPERDDEVPIGPYADVSRNGRRSSLSEAVTNACASPDLLLTLAPLDPSFGGDHLATWTADTVAVITAGRSTWTKIHAISEMIRLAGTRLVSAVLVGADETDDSLGMTYTPESEHEAEFARENPRPDAQGFFVTADQGSGGRHSHDR
jgi:capsular polysaccharide biosynthesis protein